MRIPLKSLCEVRYGVTLYPGYVLSFERWLSYIDVVETREKRLSKDIRKTGWTATPLVEL
ncbi:hypothetical protein JCM31271_27290 [Halorubrum trueperi]